MITKEWKVSRVLDTYPQTLDVFIEAAPQFKKLQNAFLRKTLAPRVTIEQAAAVAGIDAHELTAHLNALVGSAVDIPATTGNEATEPATSMPQPDFFSTIEFVTLDVRPSLDAGTDPFANIMRAAKRLESHQGLHLVNSFEPVPLYSVLAGRGFDHWTGKTDGVWNVYFFRTKRSEATEEPTTIDHSTAHDMAEPDIVELDVRGLEPPEPMMRILAKLGELDGKSLLLVHHHREPMMLYEKLEQRGFFATTTKVSDNYYRVVIQKQK